MELLSKLLSNATDKMVAIYKYGQGNKPSLDLLKGLTFCCDELGVSQDGNTIRLYDKSNSKAECFDINVLSLISTDYDPERKADKYGAYSARITIKEDDYLVKYA